MMWIFNVFKIWPRPSKNMKVALVLLGCFSASLDVAIAETDENRSKEILGSLLDGKYELANSQIEKVFAEKTDTNQIIYLEAFSRSIPFSDSFDPIKAINRLKAIADKEASINFDTYFSILDVALRNFYLVENTELSDYVIKIVKILNKEDREFSLTERYIVASANLILEVDEDRALSYFNVKDGNFDEDLLNFPDLGYLTRLKLFKDAEVSTNLGHQENLMKMVNRITFSGLKKGYPPSVGFIGYMLLSNKELTSTAGWRLISMASMSGDEASQEFIRWKTRSKTNFTNFNGKPQYKRYIFKNFKEEIKFCNSEKMATYNMLSNCILKSVPHDMQCRFEYLENMFEIKKFRTSALYRDCRFSLLENE